MTIRELKEIINSVDESQLDKEIEFFYEFNNYSTQCEGAILDVGNWNGEWDSPALTICYSAEDIKWHESGLPWSELGKYNEDDDY